MQLCVLIACHGAKVRKEGIKEEEGEEEEKEEKALSTFWKTCQGITKRLLFD